MAVAAVARFREAWSFSQSLAGVLAGYPLACATATTKHLAFRKLPSSTTVQVFFMNDASPGCGQPHPPTLDQLGWTADHTEAFAHYSGPYLPGRVACRQKTAWEVLIDRGSVMAGISGALKRLGRFPTVGDFVVLLHQPEAGTSCLLYTSPSPRDRG